MQRETTEIQLERLLSALAQSRALLPANDTTLFRAMLAALESQIGDLRNELAEYETHLEAPSPLAVTALSEVPQALVHARLARNLSLSDLSQRLNINPEELEAYEASGYRTARFEDVLRIARALRVEIRSQPVPN
ncbi:MAG: helix-turn-helix transcriptional regulator [Chloroflexi bacterium]|nr:helix-turn-helix transcriptional regulator [Chloroflexota bacterium]